MTTDQTKQVTRETDYLIIGAGAMGIAFADEIFHRRPNFKITIVDRRSKAGGHWNNAYPFVKLHQPAAFYGVNSRVLGNGSTDLSSKTELLEYYDAVIRKMVDSGRVEFLGGHNYLGNGQVKKIDSDDEQVQYKINKKVVDATYMNVEVPSTHAPKYQIDEGVPIVPINDLASEHQKWEKFYVIGSGKTGMDAILFLLDQAVDVDNIYWISPNQAWLFNRDHIQVGTVATEILKHASCLQKANTADDIFQEMEKTGGIMRLNNEVAPLKWRCATVNPKEIAQLRRIKNLIEKGRVKRISLSEIQLENGIETYSEKALFVDASANGLARKKQAPIFTKDQLKLQPILFCQQVFSAATIARMELTGLSDKRKNQLTPVPHPEWKEDWPDSLASSVKNLLLVHRHFPLWMFRSRLNFMSHEPILKYYFYAVKAMFLAPGLEKAANRIRG